MAAQVPLQATRKRWPYSSSTVLARLCKVRE
jgi:hypothetical protein